VEAEIAKNRLEELKLHEENRRKEAMRSRQIAERLGVEEAHMLEFQQFNMVWDKKMAEYEHHAENLVEAMKVRERETGEQKRSKRAMRVLMSRVMYGICRVMRCLVPRAKRKTCERLANGQRLLSREASDMRIDGEQTSLRHACVRQGGTRGARLTRERERGDFTRRLHEATS